jgi:hypothetical protein
MRVSLADQIVQLGIDGTVTSRSEPLPDSDQVDGALHHVEAYINTVDWGQCLDAQFAKASMFEALLYLLAAPFAHEHMKLRRRSYAIVDSRGPQVLYIFGHAQNGKSTFAKFALRLLTGRHVLPLPGGQFSKTRVLGTSSVGTVFPLVFDDVDLSKKAGAFEEVLKSYWEVWWREACVVPQLVFTGNVENLKEWAKSRLKRVDFDVHFAPTEEQKAALARILEFENPLFKWFAHLYLKHLGAGPVADDDELHLARTVMGELYRHAGRPLPAFFPPQPVDQIYDPGRRAWLDLLYSLRKASLRTEGRRLLVSFKDEMQYREVAAYRAHLPQTVKHATRGKTLVIESPGEFHTWLRGGTPPREGWLRRLFTRVGWG